MNVIPAAILYMVLFLVGFRSTPLAQALPSIVASFLAHLPERPPEGYSAREKELALVRVGGTR